MKKTLFTYLLLAIAVTTYGQDTLSISKDEFVGKVIQNSYQKQIVEKQEAMARADFQQSNSLFLPK
uniref:hypothetical protein n=1 Tax=Fulvivirga sp. TaxID=1931237 RepID=UPI00404A24BE